MEVPSLQGENFPKNLAKVRVKIPKIFLLGISMNYLHLNSKIMDQIPPFDVVVGGEFPKSVIHFTRI